MVVVGIYTPTNVDVIHKIDVDVVNRDDIPEPLHLVQYDQKIQVVEVSLWNGGEAYTVPTGAGVNVRYLKPDHTFVYNPALGVNNSRSVVYFQVSQEMTTAAGRGSFIIEIMTDDNKVLGTATAEVIIDKNPVQNDGIESKSEFKTLLNYVTEAEASKNAAKVSEDNAASSAAAASTSARNAKTSETNAANSAAAASTSARNAKTSETNAANSAAAASDSADKAKISETNAKTSETAAKESETKAKTSETNAKTSETAAKTSELKAKTSEDNAKTSETNAANSATAASNSATASAKSAQNAKTSEANSASSASIADDSARDALSSEQNAKTSETNAGVSAAEALMSKNAAAASASQAYVSETNAANSAQEVQTLKENIETELIDIVDTITDIGKETITAKNDAEQARKFAAEAATNASVSETNAAASATAAEASAQNNEHYAKLSESYAVGTGGSRENEAIDNSKYYYEQAKDISEGLKGTLKPKGTIPFADLPPLSEVEDGWSYNISDKFTTTEEFKEGADHTVPAGANIYKTADGLWDVLAGTPVSSVNGQTGDVQITPYNIDAFPGTILIPSNSDLNDYKTPGVYYLPATSTNVQNKPYNAVAVSYGLVVIRCTNTVVKQFIFRASTAEGDFQVRDFMTSWTEWFRLPVGIKGNREDSYRGGFVNLTPEQLGAVPYYNSTHINSSTDWNNILDPGTYRVDVGVNLGGAPNAPAQDEYGYGTLIVFWADNNNNTQNRKVQIYIPDESYPVSPLWIRTVNSNNWTSWIGLPLAENFVKKIGGDTMYGPLTVKPGSTDGTLAINVISLDGTKRIAISANNDGVRGLWDSNLGWFAYLDAQNNLLLKGNDNIALAARNTFLQNTGVASLGGNYAVYEWVVAAQITVNGIWLNHTLKIEIGGRGRAATAELFVMFDSTDNTDPGLAGFWYRGASDTPDWIRIKKTAAHTWQIIALKQEDYGDIFVASVNSQYQLINSNAVSITYPGTGVPITSVDSTWTAPKINGAVKNASRLYYNNETIIELSSGALYPTTYSGTINLGSTSRKWNKVYANELLGKIDGAYFPSSYSITNYSYSTTTHLIVESFDMHEPYAKLRDIFDALFRNCKNFANAINTKVPSSVESSNTSLYTEANTGNLRLCGGNYNYYFNSATNGGFLIKMVNYQTSSPTEKKLLEFTSTNDTKLYNNVIDFFASSGFIRCFGSSNNIYSIVQAKDFSKQSSKRYKENIKDITEEEAKKLLDIRIVSFDFKEEFGGQKFNFGVIAEELFKVIPYAVICKDEQPEAVDYSSLVPHTIKMVQIHDDELTEVKEELSKANEKITELEQKNQELEQRLAKLEALLLK